MWRRKKKTTPKGPEQSGPAPELILDTHSDVVSQLIDQVIFLSTESQTLFADTYSDAPAWRVQLDEPTFWFESEPRAYFQPHVVGTSAQASNSWMWAWNNINNFPDAAVNLARRVRDLGLQHDAADFTTARQTLDPVIREAQGFVAHSVPERLYIYCAQAVSGLRSPVYYRAPAGNTSIWLVLENDEQFSLTAPSPLATTLALSRSVTSGYVTNHRRAVTAYAQRREGVSLDIVGEHHVVLSMAAGQVDIDIDDAGRIVDLATSSARGKAQISAKLSSR